MIQIDNLEEWTKDYFSKPENITRSEKACERYDRLMVKQIRRHLSSGTQTINLKDMTVEDPGKCLEKAKYETIPRVRVGTEKGSLRINLLDRTAEFIPE